MRYPLRLILFLLLILTALPSQAQARRLNAQNPLDIAVFCAGNDIDIYHIDNSGSGQQALYATQNDINWGLLQARNSNSAYTIANGNYGVTLTALPGIRLRASQRFDGRTPYDFDFAGDSCAPVNLPASSAPVTNSGGVPSTTVSGASNTTATTTGTIDYTVQPGDSWYRIARRFNVTLNELAAANGTIPSDIIYPGQTLKVPNQVVQAAPNTTASSDPGIPQITVDSSGNYLQDPSFEGIYTGRGAPDFNIPGAWGVQVITSPRSESWQNLRPYAFPRRDPPIHGGSFSLNVNRGYATFSIILFQRVSVPANARLEAGAWAWYDTCDAGRAACNNSGNPNFRVGIDPNGGTNPYESDIVWGSFIAPQGFWQNTTASATAQGSVVTMYISASQDRPRAINELFIDDAYLIQR